MFFKKEYAKNPITFGKEDTTEKNSTERKPDCIVTSGKVPLRNPVAQFENGIGLLSARLPAHAAKQAAFFVELYFRTDKLLISPPCEIELSLYSKKGKLMDCNAHEPGDWSYPTPQWRTGEIINDVFLFRILADLTEPEYDLYLKVISGPTFGSHQGNRIKALGDNNEKGIFLGVIRMVNKKRKHIIPGLYSYKNSRVLP